MIRFFDIMLSVVGLIILSPLIMLVSLWIKLDSKGPVLYRQQRIGLNGVSFDLFKFRTMYSDSDKKGLLTVGNRDARITNAGYYLRKYKLDELPQLFNVLLNEMSFVGPRPELKRYVDIYTLQQAEILNVKPGITDYASIYYKNENEMLALATDPEHEYISRIMPHKIILNLKYIKNSSLNSYFTILFKTILSIFK